MLGPTPVREPTPALGPTPAREPTPVREPTPALARRRWSLCVAAAVISFAAPAIAAAQDVSTEDVKRFLDPTVMVNHVDYTFGANFLPREVRAYQHKVGGFWAVNSWTGFWADVPIRDFSFPDAEGPAGVGDILLGWGIVTHENLERRVTTSALLVEVLAPSGDPKKGTGADAWVLSPTAALVFNPTDVFPVYVTARYLHSFGSLGGGDDPDDRLRSLELSVRTIHILPKGFFLVAAPQLLVNFNQEFNVFSVALGGGRALTRSFAWNAAYVQHVAGKQTFNRGFAFGIQYIFGQRKDQ